MKPIIKILMVDDHPLTLRGYELSLNEHQHDYSYEFYMANDSEQALQLLQENGANFFHIIFLDIHLPFSKNHLFINGEELGIKIKKMSDAKVVVISSIGDTQRIYSILNNLKPDSFIIKSEATPEILVDAITSVLNETTFFCGKIAQLIDSQENEEAVLDVYDIKILYYLSLGEKMKNLPHFVHLSIASIERRKKKIKSHFGNQEASDRELIEAARVKGFL